MLGSSSFNCRSLRGLQTEAGPCGVTSVHDTRSPPASGSWWARRAQGRGARVLRGLIDVCPPIGVPRASSLSPFSRYLVHGFINLSPYKRGGKGRDFRKRAEAWVPAPGPPHPALVSCVLDTGLGCHLTPGLGSSSVPSESVWRLPSPGVLHDFPRLTWEPPWLVTMAS